MNTPTPLPWWQYFIRPVFSWQRVSLNGQPTPSFNAYVLPMVIFAFTVFCCAYWMYSHDHFIEQLHARAETRAKTDEQHETIELAREATNRVLNNPAFRILISLDVVYVSARGLLILLLMVWMTLSIIAERWTLFQPFWLTASTSTSVLSIGVVINTMVKTTFLEEDAPFTLLLFFRSYDGTDPVHFVLARSDLFSLYFLALVSFRTSTIFNEHPLHILSLSVACWIMTLLLAFLLDVRFSLIL